MSEPLVAPYGTWRSPITAALVAGSGVSLSEIVLDGSDAYWLEGRPAEAGRQVVVRRSAEGHVSDVTPAPFNARTRVHEYGGGSYAVDQGTVYFSNFADGRLYRQERQGLPVPISPDGELRYADLVVDRQRRRLLAVREDHRTAGREAVNTLVALSLDGQGAARLLAQGNDFYANPRLSPDGSRLSWLTWNHPNLPWDGTELWVGDLEAAGAVRQARLVAGGDAESIFDPKWSPDGLLYFVSDRTGWWNLYRERHGQVQPLAPGEAEFGQPQWRFGASSYAFVDRDRLVCRVVEHGQTRLLSIDLASHQVLPLQLRYTEIGSYVQAAGPFVYFDGGAPSLPQSVLRLDLGSSALEVLRQSRQISVDAGYFSSPESIEFPTEDGRSAFGFYYPPRNRDFAAPAGELAPLIVHSHGGPTSQATRLFSLGTQFWTSRGFAVLDVNYGGSTGYGRAYRQRLEGQWGVVDVDDCVNGARYLVRIGKVDGDRLAISGGSAGGYTTLCALTFRDVFRAGASHFGIGDLETFVHDTHKFESRYLDRLVGTYPEQRDRYRERSAINFTDRLSCPVILFQGLEDKIVPPNQAETMVDALRRKGLPVAYLPFEGEQHGFRKAENIQRALEAELYFYARVFGFTPADPLEPVPIDNLP